MAEYRRQIVLTGVVAAVIVISAGLGIFYLQPSLTGTSLASSNTPSLTSSSVSSNSTSIYSPFYFTNLVDGPYTIAAGDEWGALVLSHFTVSDNSSTPLSSVQSTNSSVGLKLSIATNWVQVNGGTMNITVSEENLLSSVNNVTRELNWAMGSLGQGFGPCFFTYPFMIAIFRGFYTSSNVSEAAPLNTVNPRFYPPCPAVPVITYYLFQPNSDNASTYSCYSPSNPCVVLNQISQIASYPVNGFWLPKLVPLGSNYLTCEATSYKAQANEIISNTTTIYTTITLSSSTTSFTTTTNTNETTGYVTTTTIYPTTTETGARESTVQACTFTSK